MAEIESIRCMQLPLHNQQLLLPNSAVAEIIGYTSPEAAHQGSGWYDGKISWRGVLVPVVSVEKMCGMETAESGHRTRIAIIYNPNGDQSLPYLGLILKDIPRAYLAEPERLQAMQATANCDYLLGQADAMFEQLYIPDLDAIIEATKQRSSH
ncbi:MAG: chemotaxis protein CheW [Gammaproteobacteria bacterium]|nr:chemotaxis protein CheW [Gammaproteobacteria bacterium]